MNIRTAILKAADSIEQNPDIYNWSNVQVPPCGTPGGMLGLIGAFRGMDCGKKRRAD